MDDIADFITLKKMIEGYENGAFVGGTGPSFQELTAHTISRQSKSTAKIIDSMNTNMSDLDLYYLSSNIADQDTDCGSSPPRHSKKRKRSLIIWVKAKEKTAKGAICMAGQCN